MATRKVWPKAANEARADSIMEGGSIRGKAKTIRAQAKELQEAINRRDLILAIAIASNIDSLAEVIDTRAEMIVLKLENAKAEE